MALALDRHLGTQHVMEFRAAIADLPRTGRSLTRFVIESAESF